MEGHVLTDVETRRGDLRIPFPRDFAARMRGRKVIHLRRRAKYILADLDSGETLVIHLGMSGRMSVYAHGKQRRIGSYIYDKAPEGAGNGKHDHVVFETDAPARIIFNDHRRFGLMTLVETKTLEQDKLFKDIGIEPLSPSSTPPIWHARWTARRRRSSRRCWTSAWWRGWAISMSAKPCSAAASRPRSWQGR